MMRHAFSAIGFLVFLAAHPGLPASFAGQASQGAATLAVTVRDNWGVIPGASVRLTTHTETKATTRLLTDGSGVAVFSGLPAGTVDLTTTFAGFADDEQKGIALAAGGKKAVTVTLALAQFSTSITVTTASRREELLLNVAEPTTLIDRSHIDDTGARTAKDVLVEQAGTGVRVHPGGGQGHISINGIPNKGVLVLIDGRRVLGRDGTGNFNLEDIDLTGVERVEVVKGAGSALYGSDAIGGVVNFITKKSTTLGATNRLSFNAGSYTDVRVSDSFGYRGARGGIDVSGGYRTYDGFDLDKKNPQTIGQPESKFYTAGASSDFRITSKVIARFFGNYSRRDIDNYYFSGATQLAATVYNSQREITRYTVSPEVEFLPTSNTMLSVAFTSGKYNRDERQIYATREVVPVPWQEWNREFRATGRQTWKARGQSQHLQLGYEFRREIMDRASLRFLTTGQRRSERDTNVAWLQQEVNLTDAVKLTAGLRYDDYSDFGSKWSPKVSAVYSIGQLHRVRASYGHGFRAPLFGELYLYTPPFFVGNANLRPENSATVSAGYSYAGPKLQLSGDYFRAQVKNGIVFDLQRLPYTYMNLARYVSRGVNTAVSANLPGGLAPSVSYSYVKRLDETGKDVGGMPAHSVFLKLLWADPRRGLRANVRAQLQSEAIFEDGTSQPSYQVWYAQVNKKLVSRGAYAVSIFVQGDNLFNKNDIFRRTATGTPIVGDFQVWLAPRTFMTGFSVDMDWTGAR